MANKLLGRVTVLRNGNQLLSNKGCKFSLAGVSRKPVIGDTPHGYTEEAVVGEVEFTISLSDDVDLQDLANDEDTTLMVTGDAGGSWLYPHAVQQNRIEATGGDGGQVPLKYFAATTQKVG